MNKPCLLFIVPTSAFIVSKNLPTAYDWLKSNASLILSNIAQTSLPQTCFNVGAFSGANRNGFQKGSIMSKKVVEIQEPKGKLGVLLVGLGAVSTTFVAGVEAIKKGLAEPVGSLTQMG